jgi:hypothetical protein
MPLLHGDLDLLLHRQVLKRLRRTGRPVAAAALGGVGGVGVRLSALLRLYRWCTLLLLCVYRCTVRLALVLVLLLLLLYHSHRAVGAQIQIESKT